jgi:hypothetical protein
LQLSAKKRYIKLNGDKKDTQEMEQSNASKHSLSSAIYSIVKAGIGGTLGGPAHGVM